MIDRYYSLMKNLPKNEILNPYPSAPLEIGAGNYASEDENTTNKFENQMASKVAENRIYGWLRQARAKIPLKTLTTRLIHAIIWDLFHKQIPFAEAKSRMSFRFIGVKAPQHLSLEPEFRFR